VIVAGASDIATLYDEAVSLRRADRLDEALQRFLVIIDQSEPIAATETDDAFVVPYQAEPSQFAAAAGKTEHGKPVKLVMDYFTAAIYNIGCVHALRENFAQAKKYLDEALELWPDNVAIKLQASFVYARLGELGNAEAVLQEAEELAPDNPLIFRQLAWTYNEATRHEKAVTAARQALALNPAQRDAAEELLYALEELGRVEEAEGVRRQLAALPGPPDKP
jgi:tetratricopeptide (TPR) repeat protein